MRPASHSIERRGFLGGATSAALGLFAGRPARAQTRAEARLVVSSADAGVPLAPDFIGLSYESAILAAGIRGVYACERLGGWRRMVSLRMPDRRNALGGPAPAQPRYA